MHHRKNLLGATNVQSYLGNGNNLDFNQGLNHIFIGFYCDIFPYIHHHEPGFGRTGFGRDQIYPDLWVISHTIPIISQIPLYFPINSHSSPLISIIGALNTHIFRDIWVNHTIFPFILPKSWWFFGFSHENYRIFPDITINHHELPNLFIEKLWILGTSLLCDFVPSRSLEPTHLRGPADCLW